MKIARRRSRYPVRFRISYSMLSAWLACRERAKLHYQMGLRKKADRAEARDIGSEFHEGLDLFYTRLREEGRVVTPEAISHFYASRFEKHEEAMRDAPDGVDQLRSLSHAIQISEPMLRGYVDRWAEVDQDREWPISEGEFVVPAPGKWGEEGVVLHGYWDGVFVNKAGETWVFETKTKSRISEASMVRLPLDLQLAVYHHAAEHYLGHPAVGSVYNIVMRPQLRQKKGRKKDRSDAETDKQFRQRVIDDINDRQEHYFQRFEIPMEPDEIKDGRNQLIEIIGEFMEWQRGRRPTYRTSHSCENPFRCSFLELCAGGNLDLYEQVSKR